MAQQETPSPMAKKASAKTDKAVLKRMHELREWIHTANAAYYGGQDSGISDAEYDRWLVELMAIEEDHPEWVTPDSPTQRVGAPLEEGSSFEKVEHAVPMLSIASLFAEEEVRDFEEKIERFLGVDDDRQLSWSVEPKFDGVSASLTYEKGVFVRGITRGNGKVGEDITANLKTIRNLPLRLQEGLFPIPDLLEVRGEVLIATARFHEFNKERVARDQPLLANARNATAGALRRNDPAEVARYPLEFYSYSAPRIEYHGKSAGADVGLFGEEAPVAAQASGGSAESGSIESQSQLFEALQAWGFPVSGYQEVAHGLDECLAYHDRLEAGRDAIPFEIDGVVCKLDGFAIRERLGRTARSTRWQYAHKFAPRSEVSTLLAIEIQVGTKGRLTPRAHLVPVGVGGVTVRHATLHNEEHVQNLGLHPGDRVYLERAGDVIPQVTGVASLAKGTAPEEWERGLPASLRDAEGELRNGVVWRFAQDFVMPEQCPACGTNVERSGKYVICPNSLGCIPQRMGRTILFAARAGIEIESIGEKGVEQLFTEGLISSPADLFYLKKEDLMELEGWGEKSAANLIKELAASRNIPFGKFLSSLAIPGLGGTVGDLLATNFASLEELQAADSDTLQHIDGLGPVTTGHILEWFEEPQNLAMLERMFDGGVTLVHTDKSEGGVLDGLRVVFTGTLEGITRAEAKKWVEDAGGKVSSSISAKTDLLIQGGKPGSKAKKALDLGVEVLDEAQFRERLGQPPE
ncbi:MAG: DNA ligase (NAD+) [Planctomycetota bacterium]|jgi:DNA ligase (NAD+)